MIFKYPYTDLYNLNLDWVIQAIKEVQETITNLGTVVNTFNGQSGDVTLSAADIASIVGGIVNSFNGRTGAVTLTEADVNQTLIDIVWTSDPGEVIGDLSQSALDGLFAAGRRVLIFNNALGEPDRIYFLTLVGDVVTPQQYIPTGAIAGVASVNGQTGAVTVRGDTIPVSGTDPTTVEDALAAKEDVLTFDNTPTAGSSNPVTSAGIQAADAAIRTDLTTLNNTVSGIDNRLESAEQGLTYAEQDISTLSQQIDDLGPYNGLDSDSTVAALSAAQGKALKTLLDKLNSYELLLDYTDTYETQRYIYREGNTIVAILRHLNQTIASPSGSLGISYRIPEKYRPREDLCQMGISQKDINFNFLIGADGTIAGWMYNSGISGQFFATITWSVPLSSL